MLGKPWRGSRPPPRSGLRALLPPWSARYLRRTYFKMNGLIVVTIAGGLLLDVLWPQYGQIVVNACVWAVCGVLYLRIDASGRPALIACLIIATAGEIFLSLVWGLYEYRLGNIPLFVPPGHVLLFFLGTQIARRTPPGSRMVDRRPRLADRGGVRMAGSRHAGARALWILRPVPLDLALAQALRDDVRALARDGALRHVDRQLGLGRASPWLGLTMQNPPVAAGAFYCVLDLAGELTANGKLAALQVSRRRARA